MAERLPRRSGGGGGSSAAYSPLVFPSGFTGASGLVGVYRDRSSVYNLKPKHLRKSRAKMAAAVAGTGLFKWAAVGDSQTAGQGATFSTQSYPVVARARLAARDGVTVGGTGFVPASYVTSGNDSRWTFGTGWIDFNPGVKTNFKQCSTNASTATFTSDIAGTSVDVIYSNASAAFTVTIDGGAPVTVTPAGGTTVATYTVTGLANTTHTVVVTLTSASNVYIAAAQVRSNATGMLMSNMGIGGSTATDWYATNQTYAAMNIVAVSIVPDLVTIALMTNDANNSIPAATYQTNVQNLITKFVGIGADVLLIAPYPPGGPDLTTYRTALYALADSNDLPLLDLFDRWGSYATANALGMMTDTLHANAEGYADYAQAVVGALSPVAA